MTMINGKEYKFSDVKLTINGKEIETVSISYNEEGETVEHGSEVIAKIESTQWSGKIGITESDVNAIKAMAPHFDTLTPLEFTSNEMITLLNELDLSDQAHKIQPDCIYKITNAE